MLRLGLVTIFALQTIAPTAFCVEFTITVDDPEVKSSPLLSPIERDKAILRALKKHSKQATLFVCGKRIDNAPGKDLLSRWNDAGHIMANHTYNHWYYHSPRMSAQHLKDDILKTEKIIENYSEHRKIFRFPYLKAGNTKEKRDKIKTWLSNNNYSHGYVTVDASDWYIDDRLRARLEANPNADTGGYRDYYLSHMFDRASYYNSLAKKVLGREIKHTILIHHNLLNALYLDDLIEHFKSRGWKYIDSQEVFKDPIYKSHPDVLPAGESIVWSLAKENGNFDYLLRYPAEDGRYEKPMMDQLGL